MTKNPYRPKKSLGQNFLINGKVSERIVSCLDIKDKNIIEIGPGHGALTELILAQNPAKLVCIEKDTSLIDMLSSKFPKAEIKNEDALNINISNIFEKCSIIGNLPYNIGTTLVLNWMTDIDDINEIVVMLQKEVVDRICAKPRTKDYGRVSVLIQSLCNVEKCFDVSPGNFFPAPNVVSSVVKITPKQNRIDKETYDKLDQFCTLGFMHRRKVLTKIASPELKSYIETKFGRNIRIEELSVNEIIDCSIY